VRTTGVDYIILNYEQIVNDWKLVEKLPRGFVVLDEATAIKSFRSKSVALSIQFQPLMNRYHQKIIQYARGLERVN